MSTVANPMECSKCNRICVVGLKTCVHCQEINRKRCKERRQRIVTAGMCDRCAIRPPQVGRGKCAGCLKKMQSIAKQTKDKRRASGVCLDCGSESRATGRLECERCLAVAKKRLAFVVDVKSHYGCMNPGCLWCGVVPTYALDFHHVGVKLFSIGAERQNKSIAAVVAEINKCVVLCSICHRMETHGELDVTHIELCCINAEGQVVSKRG